MDDHVDGVIAQWAKERPELESAAMAAFGRIYRIAAISGEAMERAYALHGLSRADFDVLATLRRAGPPFQLSPGALSSSLMVTTGGMTGRLDRLERTGLITRSPAVSDRRSLLVTLSDRGHDLIDAAVVDGLAVQQRALDALSPAKRKALDGALRTLLAAVEAER